MHIWHNGFTAHPPENAMPGLQEGVRTMDRRIRAEALPGI
jgi:hypothetical protein